MPTVEKESWKRAKDEIAALVSAHGEEVGLLYPVDLNWPAYEALDTAGLLLLVTLREEGKLAGYWTTILGVALHSRSVRTAVLDMLYVVPEARKGVPALRLLRRVEQELRRIGVTHWSVGERYAKPIGKLFSACGFTPDEVIWVKTLEKTHG